ncbi:MAG: phosphoglucomutase/phosphomannomutase family protein [Candidatus Omnitrophota bacterium]|nr:phosphoglucomutase/phosphomannomutase family protein [Candidatus Omnitrophota bacterium]
MGIKFGTDGWRAIISDGFTFENVRIASQAVADYFVGTEHCSVPTFVIGYDWRFMSEKYAELAAEVLAANGIKVLLSDKAVPTPLVSFTIKNRKLSGGLMLSASHNPPYYNGLKIKAPYAGTADEGITKSVESLLEKNPVQSMELKKGIESGMIVLADLKKDYMKFAKAYIDLKHLKNSKVNVLVDCMHGVGDGYIPEILKGAKIKITQMRTGRDPLFGGVNPEPIPKNLEAPFKVMRDKKSKYDICIVNDGDADRIGAVIPGGKFMGAGQIMALLLLHFIEDRKWKGGVVKTVSNTTLIDLICKKYKLKLYETPVGFKYICRLMLDEDILIGGEESGGIGVKNYMPERDGMLLGALLVEMMAYRKKGILEILKDVEKEYGAFRYQRIDLDYADEKKKKLMELLKTNPPKEVCGKRVKETKSSDGHKFIMEDNSWLILRLSGTEPILRIYAEAPSEKLAKSYLDFGKTLALSM